MDRAGAAIITVGGLWQCGGVEEFEDRVAGGEPAEERPTTAAGASAESGSDPSSTPAAIDPSAPLADPVDGGGDRPEIVSTLWQGEGMEEFEDPAQGQNQANMPDLAAAIAAVALPVVPAAVPVVDPPLVRFPDRAHPGCRWRRPGRGRTPRRTGTRTPWPRSPNSPGWKPGPRP